MEVNLQHEDILIQLRAKLNEENIKLWEPPYVQPGDEISPSLQDLAKKYAAVLSTPYDVVLKALHELQLHSVDRSKANAEFKETGFATFRVKATLPGQRPQVLKLQKKLDAMGSDLIATVASEINVSESRVKLIFNGKVIKPSPSLEEQGVTNGAQIMALVMAESPEEVKKEDNMYMEMKSTRDDALLLTECMDDFNEDEEYIKLEDQSGKAVELPPAERRSLMVGLALHERGRQAAKKHDYPLALVLYLEADRQFNECRSALLGLVDNWALLQLDIAWCYLCLQNLSVANDASARLARAEESFRNSYGENHERLIALKGTAANERVLIMRLHLLQGIVAYHQNKRAEARRLLERAERDLDALRVDENLVSQLLELGWSAGAARRGLRASGGDVNGAHRYLADWRAEKQRARAAQRAERQKRILGLCEDGSPVSQKLVDGLVAMGFSRSLAVVALRNSNNHAAEAVRLIQEQPEMLEDSDLSSSETDTLSSNDSTVEPDNKLVAELEAMGYCPEEVRIALVVCKNKINDAVDLLIAGGKHVEEDGSHEQQLSGSSPSRHPEGTSASATTSSKERTLTLVPSTSGLAAGAAASNERRPSVHAPVTSKESSEIGREVFSDNVEQLNRPAATHHAEAASTTNTTSTRKRKTSPVPSTSAQVATAPGASPEKQQRRSSNVAVAFKEATEDQLGSEVGSGDSVDEQSGPGESSGNPSTSAGIASKQKSKKSSKRKEREMALDRLSTAIRHEEDDHLDTSLVEEEEFLTRYKSLL